jgi:hypothetical protein
LRSEQEKLRRAVFVSLDEVYVYVAARLAERIEASAVGRQL